MLQEIVCESNAQQRLLLVVPPLGLLQLGRQRAALRYLEPLLHVRLFLDILLHLDCDSRPLLLKRLQKSHDQLQPTLDPFEQTLDTHWAWAGVERV